MGFPLLGVGGDEVQAEAGTEYSPVEVVLALAIKVQVEPLSTEYSRITGMPCVSIGVPDSVRNVPVVSVLLLP